MFDFSKKNKVSIWASQHPYEEIPDAYFEETFSRNNSRATNQWSDNFRMKFFLPENMETNGTLEGLVDIRQAAGECSFSASYMPVLLSKARKKKLEQVSWIVLLFDYEYSVRQSGTGKDTYLSFLGAFDYDEAADSLFEVDD